MSQVEAQYFIFQSEPNAQVSFQGVDSFIDASHDFGEWLVGIGGDISTLPLTNQPVLFQSVGSATPTGSSDGYGLILEKNKPIQVIYTGLQQTSYRGQRIDTVVYTYELLSTYATDNRATAFIFKDPTKTIYIGSFGDNQGNVDVALRQTITYYYENGEAVTFAPDAVALLSLASRNNNYSIGEQEYVVMSSGMTFIPITGSSVTEENGYIASRTSNAHVQDGSLYGTNDWDRDGHEREYYGAGVLKVTGTALTIDVGTRYNATDIARAAIPLGLRSQSRQWFALNSNIKSAGIITPLRPEPVKPVPNPALVEPTPPKQPAVPVYRSMAMPIRPKLILKQVLPPRPSQQVPKPVSTVPIHPVTKPVPNLPVPASPVPTRLDVSNLELDYALQEIVAELKLALKDIKVKTENTTPTQQQANIETNLKFTPDEQAIFFGYLQRVKLLAIQKHGHNLDKVNHILANAIAEVGYINDSKQKAVNDFNPPEYRQLPGYEAFKNLVWRTAGDNSDPIDLAHLAMPIASSYPSSWSDEIVKYIMSSPATDAEKRDIFFFLNSLTGDRKTSFGYNNKDFPTDIDAIMLYKLYLPKQYLDDALKAYYGNPIFQRPKGTSVSSLPTWMQVFMRKSDAIAGASFGIIAIVVAAALAKGISSLKRMPQDLYDFGAKLGRDLAKIKIPKVNLPKIKIPSFGIKIKPSDILKLFKKKPKDKTAKKKIPIPKKFSPRIFKVPRFPIKLPKIRFKPKKIFPKPPVYGPPKPKQQPIYRPPVIRVGPPPPPPRIHQYRPPVSPPKIHKPVYVYRPPAPKPKPKPKKKRRK